MATGFIPVAKRRTQLPRRCIHCGSSRWRGPCMWTSAPAHPSGEDHCLREKCSCQGARVAGRISRTGRCGCSLAPSLLHLCELPHGAAAVRKRAPRMLLRALTVGFVGSRFQADLYNTSLRMLLELSVRGSIYTLINRFNPFPATENRRALRPCAGRPSIARASSVGRPRDFRALKPPCHTQDASS